MVKTRAQSAQAEAGESALPPPQFAAAEPAEKAVYRRKCNLRASAATVTLCSAPIPTDAAEDPASSHVCPRSQCLRGAKRRERKLEKLEGPDMDKAQKKANTLSTTHVEAAQQREETMRRAAKVGFQRKTSPASSFDSSTRRRLSSDRLSFNAEKGSHLTKSSPTSAFFPTSYSFLPCIRGRSDGSTRPSDASWTVQNKLESKDIASSNSRGGLVSGDLRSTSASGARLPDRSSKLCRIKQLGSSLCGDSSTANARVQRWRRLGQLVLTYWCYASLYLTRKPFASARGTLQIKLSLSTEAMGWIDTAFLVAYAFTQLFVAPTVSAVFQGRMGTFFLLSFLCSSTCCFYVAVAPNHMLHLQQLLIVWGLNGAAQALVFPFLVAILQQWLAQLPGGGLGTFGLWSTCQQVGSMTASYVTGVILSSSGSEAAETAYMPFESMLTPDSAWRSAFLVPAVIVFGSGVVLYALLIEFPGNHLLKETTEFDSSPHQKRGKQERRTRDIQTKDSQFRRGVVIQSAGYAEPSRAAGVDFSLMLKAGIPLLSGAYFCMKLVRYALINWLPLLLETQFRFNALETTLGANLFEMGGVAGAISVGYISQSFFNGRCFGVISLLCALATTASWCLLRVLTRRSNDLKALTTGAGIPLWEQLVLIVLGASIAGPDSVLGGMAAASAIEDGGCSTEDNETTTGAAAEDKADCRSHRKRLIATASCIVNGSGSVGSVLQGPFTPLVISAYGWQGFLAWLGCMCAFSGILLFPLLIRDAKKVRRKYHFCNPYDI